MKRELEAKLCWSRHSPAALYLETLKHSPATRGLTLSYTHPRGWRENASWDPETNVCCSVDPGGGAETRRQRHSRDDGQPHRLHPLGGRLQAEQAHQAPLPGLQAGAGQRGQPGVAAHVRPAGAAGTPPPGPPRLGSITHKTSAFLPPDRC